MQLEDALRIGRTVGKEQGWDVFNVDSGRHQVQKDDETDLLATDDLAIALARQAGIDCDDDGNVLIDPSTS